MKELFPDDCLCSEPQLAERTAGGPEAAHPKTPAAGFRLRFNVNRVRSVLGRNMAHVFHGLGFGFVCARGRGDNPDNLMGLGWRVFQKKHTAFEHGWPWL